MEEGKMKFGMSGRVVKWLVVAAMCALPVQGFGANVSANTVVSSSIKPADGTTGQSLTTGSGVKTGHIQDGAVTAAKLGIVCPSGQYLQYNGTTWACSVGTAGPQGPQGEAGPAGPQGPAGLTSKYANIIVVAKSGGDFTDPVQALNSITDASATNPYLVKIMPGRYEVNSSSIVLKEYVDVEGSGVNASVISAINSPAVFKGANRSQISSLSILNACTSSGCAGITATQLDSYVTQEKSTFKVKDVAINMTGSANCSGIQSTYTSFDINEVDISNTATGMYAYGIQSSYGYLSVRNSRISVTNSPSGSTHGIDINGDSNWINKAEVYHVLENIHVFVGGGVSNTGVFIPVAYTTAGIPTFKNSTIYVKGPGSNIGLQSTDNIIVSDVEITVDGQGSSSPSIGVSTTAHPKNALFNNTSIKVFGGSYANIGFNISGYNMPTADYPVVVKNSKIDLTGPTGSAYAFSTSYITNVNVYNSVIKSGVLFQSGSASDVYNVVSSQLIGGQTQTQGRLTKLNCFDANFTPIP